MTTSHSFLEKCLTSIGLDWELNFGKTSKTTWLPSPKVSSVPLERLPSIDTVQAGLVIKQDLRGQTNPMSWSEVIGLKGTPRSPRVSLSPWMIAVMLAPSTTTECFKTAIPSRMEPWRQLLTSMSKKFRCRKAQTKSSWRTTTRASKRKRKRLRSKKLQEEPKYCRTIERSKIKWKQG